MNESITYRPIGYVENLFHTRNKPDTIRAGHSLIRLDPDLVQGLQGLEVGQKIIVLFHCHLSEGQGLLQHPRGITARPKQGVFSLRSSIRPNPIGVTVAEIVAIDGNVLRVSGLDALNGSPVLDIKPA
jgi:tRNA-Thr(GGU) m(6)t(6)A37 methyltransferase TsaA